MDRHDRERQLLGVSTAAVFVAATSWYDCAHFPEDFLFSNFKQLLNYGVIASLFV